MIPAFPFSYLPLKFSFPRPLSTPCSLQFPVNSPIVSSRPATTTPFALPISVAPLAAAVIPTVVAVLPVPATAPAILLAAIGAIPIIRSSLSPFSSPVLDLLDNRPSSPPSRSRWCRELERSFSFRIRGSSTAFSRYAHSSRVSRSKTEDPQEREKHERRIRKGALRYPRTIYMRAFTCCARDGKLVFTCLPRDWRG